MAVSRTRIRAQTHKNHIYGETRVWDFVKKAWVSPSYGYCPLGGVQVRNELCQDETHPGPPWKDGGPLFIKKAIQTPNHSPYYVFVSPNRSYRYAGVFMHSGVDMSGFNSLVSDPNLGTTYGATGWNRFRPVKSGADLGQFIAELRDFKSLFRFQLKSFKDLGGSYLNYQFGWKPFINDLVKFYRSMQKVERTIKFIRKNNNKWLRRGGTIKNTTTTTTSSLGYSLLKPTLVSNFYDGVGSPSIRPTIRVNRIVEHVWFRARMKYYIPDLSVDKCESVISSRLLRRIYGLELTPALLWELTPWSWLVDWFGNVGDVLAVLSSQSYDNLTAKYAYVMRRYETESEYTTQQPIATSGGIVVVNHSSKRLLSTKQRAECLSPYGFNLGWEDLSSYQLSILTALGLSRSKI